MRLPPHLQLALQQAPVLREQGVVVLAGEIGAGDVGGGADVGGPCLGPGEGKLPEVLTRTELAN